MKKKILLMIVAVMILGAVLTMACDIPDCSPGFWKNHTELWVEMDLPWEDSGMTWLEALQGGKDTRFTRHLVAAELNGLYPLTVCD